MGKVTPLHTSAAAQTAVQRCVRVTNENHRGFVEFQFSIGDPTLFLEMTLPPIAFAAFCREQQVRFLSAAEARAVDLGESKWRYGAVDEG